MPWRYFKNCKTMDSMQGSLEILSRQAFYIYMGKKEQCALVADGESFTFFNSVEDSRKKVKLETGSKESCIYWYHKNDANSREVRSKVDGLVAHGLCPQFQSRRLAPVTKSCTATCLVGQSETISTLSTPTSYNILHGSYHIYPLNKSHHCWVR